MAYKWGFNVHTETRAGFHLISRVMNNSSTNAINKNTFFSFKNWNNSLVDTDKQSEIAQIRLATEGKVSFERERHLSRESNIPRVSKINHTVSESSRHSAMVYNKIKRERDIRNMNKRPGLFIPYSQPNRISHSRVISERNQLPENNWDVLEMNGAFVANPNTRKVYPNEDMDTIGIVNPHDFAYIHNPTETCKGRSVKFVMCSPSSPQDFATREQVRITRAEVVNDPSKVRHVVLFVKCLQL